MKKIIISLLCLISLLFLCSCIESKPNDCITSGDRFVITKERTTANTIYVEMYDKTTKVIYVYIKLASSGSLTMLYDASGKPLLYEE